MSYDYNTPEWANGLAQARWANERIIWATLAILGRPKAYLDLGCGDGWCVHTVQATGTQAMGLEGSQACVDVASEYADVRLQDLSQPFDLGRTFDLISCIEVAEHLPPEASEVLADSIRHHMSKWLVWTAAPPGQGGDGHTNCQPPEYWQELFEKRGMTLDVERTELMRTVWVECVGGLWWLHKNVRVFWV